jgi:hypothetical protein
MFEIKKRMWMETLLCMFFDWTVALLITGGMNTLTPSGSSSQPVGMEKGNPWVATNNHFNETR